MKFNLAITIQFNAFTTIVGQLGTPVPSSPQFKPKLTTLPILGTSWVGGTRNRKAHKLYPSYFRYLLPRRYLK